MAKTENPKFWKRLVAICIDWGMASIISAGFFAYDSIATLLIFAVMQVALVGTLGYSVGHRVVRIMVVRKDGQRAGILRAALRTALIVLVIPAVVWDSDGVGLHDKAAGTKLIDF
jgi:uncharacterized RDD family membrane protein YckC